DRVHRYRGVAGRGRPSEPASRSSHAAQQFPDRSWCGLLLVMFAVDIVAPQFGHRQLIEAGKLVDRGVFLVPADIATAISRPRLVDGTSPVRPEELAGAEARFDPFAAFAVTFDDVALLELAHCES